MAKAPMASAKITSPGEQAGGFKAERDAGMDEECDSCDAGRTARSCSAHQGPVSETGILSEK
jgi:hypothetical protein